MLENLKSTASAANWLAAEETSYTCSELSLAEHSHLAGHLLLVMRWCPHESTKTSTAEHLTSLLCSCLPEYTSPKIFTGYAGFCTIPEHTYLIQDLRCELPTPCFFSLVSLLYKLNPTVTKEWVIDQVALYKDPPPHCPPSSWVLSQSQRKIFTHLLAFHLCRACVGVWSSTAAANLQNAACPGHLPCISCLSQHKKSLTAF